MVKKYTKPVIDNNAEDADPEQQPKKKITQLQGWGGMFFRSMMDCLRSIDVYICCGSYHETRHSHAG